MESYFDKAGQPSNSVTYTYLPSAPSAPVSVQATPGNGSATVRWQVPQSDGGSPITGYTVDPASSPGQPSVRETASATKRSLSFTDLQAGAPWTFSVRAVSKKGVGLNGLTTPVVPGLGADGYLIETTTGAVLGFGDIASRGGIAGEGSDAAGIATTPSGLGDPGCDHYGGGDTVRQRSVLRPGRKKPRHGYRWPPER